jgi:nucleolar GTP-binding protein
MNFQSVMFVPSAQEVVEIALRKARRKADSLGKSADKVRQSREAARARANSFAESVVTQVSRVVESYPDLSNLPEFYEQLCGSQFDIDEVRQALGRLQGVVPTIRMLARGCIKDVGALEDGELMKKRFNVFVGRAKSVLVQAGKGAGLLNAARDSMVVFPLLKIDHYTVALAGFPNVGKSTLLSKLTSAKPKIANYSFTTKTLNVGYYKEGYHDVQVVDTPGALARFEKMNAVEQMAFLCVKYAAHLVVMVIDPTPGYSLEEQRLLVKQVREHDKELLFYISKTDIADKSVVKGLVEEFGALTSPEEVKNAITRHVQEHFS